MQAVIYAGLRNGARDQQIFDALNYKYVIEVAKDFQLAPGTVRAAAKRISNVTVFELTLLGGGQPDGNRQSRCQFVPKGRALRLSQLSRHLPQP
ncbi:hypothetical protein [Pseudomonas fluorescens]|uniref:Uncharacterized protein n=1 Tax=Pseudomonas fluorescens TaxID=294 RepID=A0A7Z3H054_PSEFL|nr:hypothetical protein [Pseudomonas fluorescens]QJP95458.1 hypothetical protein C6Y56_12955 [Pseudomonas fluorescens]